MTKTERTIYAILGPTRHNISPLAQAVDLMTERLFSENIAMDDILVTKDIYPEVAHRIGRSSAAVSKQVERLANLCWEAMCDAGEVEYYIGKRIHDIHAPSEMICYLAFFVHFDAPFFKVIRRKSKVLL